MVKDPKSGEILRADHMVEQWLQDRLDGNQKAHGQVLVEDAKRKKKTQAGPEVVKLDDSVVKEYEEVLAKVSLFPLQPHSSSNAVVSNHC